MTVREFVEKYKNVNEKLDQYSFIEDHIVKKYLPYIQKVALAKTLNDATMYKWVESTDENANPTKVKTDQVKISSHIRNLLIKRMVIENYTDLEVEESSFYNEYDLLQECGVMDWILEFVKVDIREFKSVCDMIRDDTLKNEYEMNAQIIKIADMLGNKFDPVFEALASKIQSAESAEIINALGAVASNE